MRDKGLKKHERKYIRITFKDSKTTNVEWFLLSLLFDVIYQTRRLCLTTFPNIDKRVENTTRSGVFLKNFVVFGNVVKHGLECLMYRLDRN